ncbi:MAG TPA: S8/S53 family peptidase [Tahibacter sp.]|nr:S8/S53 family peptidase [Tahibacter sp.]
MAFIAMAAHAEAQTVPTELPADYVNWCGIGEVLEFEDSATAQRFIDAQDDPGRFVRDGKVVFVRSPYPLIRSHIGANRNGSATSELRSIPFKFVRLNRRDELYWVDRESGVGGDDGAQRPDVNSKVSELIGAKEPLSRIPFTRRLRVAVLDTGVFDHREFERSGMRDSVLRSYSLNLDEVSSACANGDCCSEDLEQSATSDPHATKVAGLIAAADDGTGISGLGEVAELMSIPVLEAGHGCFSRRRLVAAYRCAVRRGADIVNISMQSEPRSARPVDLERAIERRDASRQPQQAGTLVVVAAGNRFCNFDADKCGVWPGEMSLPNVISVEALQTSLERVPSSNRGESIDISVPAPTDLGICTTTSQNRVNRDTQTCDDGYTRFGQTSAAAAIATGAATRIWGHPNFDRCTAEQIRLVMRGYGRNIAQSVGSSCLLQVDFLYGVRRDNLLNTMNLCACPELTETVKCGEFRETSLLCGGEVSRALP